MDRQQKINKICFGLGTVGRDALYSLVSMYLVVNLTEVITFSDRGLAAIAIMLTLFGIFDAVIDPFVGAIVDNTKTRWGKYKPWIIIGMVGTAILSTLMFHNFRMSEGMHILLLGATYLLFSIFFSLNDIAYWSLMPAISKDPKVREGVGSFARICANVGMFSMVLIYPMVKDKLLLIGFDDARRGIFLFAGISALVMCAFQIITLIGVKEDRSQLETAERIGLKDLFCALFKNDQLLICAVSMALFMVGYCSTTAFGTYYFRYAYKDGDMYIVFAAVLAVAQLSALMLFPVFRKILTRKGLYIGSMISVTVSYLIFFFSFEKLPLIVIAGLGLFFAQAIIQLLMLLFLADSVEYGEWKLGKRSEAASFAVQPFVNQVGGAISKGVLSFTLIISGLNAIPNRIEEASIPGDPEANKIIADEIIAGISDYSIWIMKLGMMILPLICILVGFILYIKRFRIDERFYDEILSDLEKRNGATAAPSAEANERGAEFSANTEVTNELQA